MSDKITIQDIVELLAEKHNLDKKDAELFVKGMFDLIKEALVSEKYVKVKGLGAFKLTEVDSRESVNVNTGERFEIQGHTKISYTPDTSIRELINKPFAHFETVILNEKTELTDTPTGIEGEEETDDVICEKENQVVVETEKPKEKVIPIDEMAETITSTPTLDAEDPMPEASEEAEQPISPAALETKKKSSWGIVVAVILILCIAGGVYWYLNTVKEPAQLPNEKPIPAVKVAPKDSIAIAKDTISPLKEDTSAMMPVQTMSSNVDSQTAKVVLTDTVEYIITGTQTNYTLQEGESLIKIAIKFYGSKKMWLYIVQHNKEIIKDADRVPIGTILRIPELTPKNKP